jgi:NAD(P)H-hydrate epimerase
MRYDFAVDALLGTGIKSAPRGWIAEAVSVLNALDCPVIAVDIPSGVDADTGAAPGAAVRADWTVTFAYPKLGLFLSPGHELAGKLRISDIGFAWNTLSPSAAIQWLACPKSCHAPTISDSPAPSIPAGWERLLQKRRPETNKGDYGHVGILAGSRGMTGAAALCARAAQRAGAGLVTVLTSSSAQPIIAAKLDEQMTIPLPESDGAVGEAAFDSIVEFGARATALCIGPGLTTKPETVRLIQRLIRECRIPIVLDADGLNALAMRPETAQERGSNLHSPLVMTPHPGEAARLLGRSVSEIQSNRVEAVRELAQKFQAVAVLKGRYTLIADPTGNVRINTTGNPGMATGGMGDTLTGIVGSLIAQDIAGERAAGERVPILEAVALGVHLHGIAGDIAAEQRGETGIIAGDVIEHLPAARWRLSLEA